MEIQKLGVCTMYLDVGMDDGDIILKEEVDIDENENAGHLWNRLSTLGARMLVDTLNNIKNGIIKRQKQGDNFTIAPKLEKELSKIDWKNKTAIQIKNLVRGLTPGMGTYTFLKDKKIKFWKVDCFTNEEFINNFPEFKNYEFDKNYGNVIYSDYKKGLFINAKEGIISVLEIQAENSKKMKIADFLRGNKIEVNSKFE